jgi:putative transcriptional regulator
MIEWDGRYLRDFRRAKGWSQAQLGERAGISQSAVGRAEASRHGPDLVTAYALSEALSVPLCALLGLAHPVEQKPVEPVTATLEEVCAMHGGPAKKTAKKRAMGKK